MIKSREVRVRVMFRIRPPIKVHVIGDMEFKRSQAREAEKSVNVPLFSSPLIDA